MKFGVKWMLVAVLALSANLSFAVNAESQGTWFSKSQKTGGALLDDTGSEVVGIVEIKTGKISKKNTVKVSGSITLMTTGKKITAKGSNMTLTGGLLQGTLMFKTPVGAMSFVMDTTGAYTLENSEYSVMEATLGGNLSSDTPTVSIEIDEEPDFGDKWCILDDALPEDLEFTVKGNKWVFPKAAKVKYKKVKEDGETSYELSGLDDDDDKVLNYSGMKLSYSAKTGTFKGSFRIYLTNYECGEDVKKPKLKKKSAKITGVVLGGAGYGSATMSKPKGGPWPVTIQ
ncbi:MAG: hypothetical protein IKR48_06000 [Kiritimatiellae bacterium]|nr:hypothetical protein [Kiritimatiellia bacterium]